MAVGSPVLTIQEFLLAHTLGDADEILDHPSAALSDPDRPRLRGANLRDEIGRHSDRTMTVVTMSGIETITRCRTCPKEDTRPCMALRVLAQPYAQHPAYRPEWRIPRPEPVTLIAQWSPGRER